jgi:hypothetical protein
VNNNDVLLAIQRFDTTARNMLVFDPASISMLAGLLRAARQLEMDDRLEHDVIIVSSLLTMGQHRRAFERLKRAVIDAYFRTPSVYTGLIPEWRRYVPLDP